MLRTSCTQRRGFNLVEAAIVLGVVGLVIGGIWVAASTVSANMRINQLSTDIMAMRVRTDQMIDVKTYAGMNVTLVDVDGSGGPGLGMGIFPQNWISGNYAINPFGGRTSLSINQHADARIGTYIGMTLYGRILGPGSLAPFPQGECIQFLRKLFGAMQTGSDSNYFTRILWVVGSPSGVVAYSNTPLSYEMGYLAGVCSGANELRINWAL